MPDEFDPADSLDRELTQAHSASENDSLSDSLDSGETATGDRSSTSDISEFDEGWEEVEEPTRLDKRYQIEHAIGHGGMGEVYRAMDSRLKRPVAIKRLKGKLSRNRRAVERFAREAEAVARLNHFNIVQIHDVGRDGDGNYIVMELVEGDSLADLLEESGSLDLNTAIDLTCQLCDALSYAHSQGIVHRDVKPANILLDDNGVPKLTDFGLARLEDADQGQTREGAVLGTLAFMPPEQHRGARNADARSDQWALAASFYQMVTGESPRVIRPDRLPKSVQGVVLKALEENPNQRFEDCRAFRDALLAIELENTSNTSEAARKPLAMGQCPECETKNELQSAFCASCGFSLRKACLRCEDQIGVWSDFCTGCGADQADELKSRSEQFTQSKSDLDSLRRSYRHHEAIEQLELMARLENPLFADQIAWAETKLFEYRTELEQLERQRDDILASATERMHANDVENTMKLLERIPASLFNPEADALRRWAEGRAEEIRELGAQIRSAVTAKRFEGLSEKVEQFLVLRPDDAKARKLQRQLKKRAETAAAGATAVARERMVEGLQSVETSTAKSDLDAAFVSAADTFVPAGNDQPLGGGLRYANNRLSGRSKPLRRKRGMSLAIGSAVVLLGLVGLWFWIASHGTASGEREVAAGNDAFGQDTLNTSPSNPDADVSSAFQPPAVVDGPTEKDLVDPLGREAGEAVATRTPALNDLGTSPQEARNPWVSLFDGSDLGEWLTLDGEPATWRVKDGYAEVTTGSLKTKRRLGPDFLLQVEFWVPNMPGRRGQARANSGIYLHGRYEVQILDSYLYSEKSLTSCGAIYGLAGPKENRCLPPETWQKFDIVFRAPRIAADASILKPGSVTVALNGHVIVDDFAIRVPSTKGSPLVGSEMTGPIILQDHGAPVRFRNIRYRELTSLDDSVAESVSMSQPSVNETTLSDASLSTSATGTKLEEAKWISLFNGRDLDGWTLKARGEQPNVDPLNTFRVESDLLTVNYDQYKNFNDRFSYLFYHRKFSRYRLRFEYRFRGPLCAGARKWAEKNSGLHFHAESPGSMFVDQEYPVSLLVQLRAAVGPEPQTTANLTTPGTTVVMNGEIVQSHLVKSLAKASPTSDWVTVELDVDGAKSIEHRVNGRSVLVYSLPEYDRLDAHANALLARQGNEFIDAG